MTVAGCAAGVGGDDDVGDDDPNPDVQPVQLGGKADGTGYAPSQAVAYADAHWNDGQGLCAEFTTRSLRNGSLDIGVITYVPSLFAALVNVQLDEYKQGSSPNTTPGDVVIYSDATGESFCTGHGQDEYNCGHACIVATSGKGEDTVMVDCHNSAHYHLGLGYILGGSGRYSSYRIYHLSAEPSSK